MEKRRLGSTVVNELVCPFCSNCDKKMLEELHKNFYLCKVCTRMFRGQDDRKSVLKQGGGAPKK